MKLQITVIIVLFLASECVSKKYNNYTLIRGIPVTDKHLEIFKNLSTLYNVNYWREPGLPYRPVEFVIAPEKKTFFTRHAMKHGIYYTTIIEDVQRAFDMQSVKSYIRRNMDSFDWKNYFRLDDIYNWLQDLSKMYPERMHLKSIGKTHEQRDILAVEISLGHSNKGSKVFVEGGIHAREWISIAFVTYLLNEIVTSPESKKGVLKEVAEKYEWYFVPVVNPDGYEYTHTKDRLHRKNINGVDLNRNFEVEFGTVGVSSDKQSEIYCGPHAFSEPESLALANYIKSKSSRLQYYLAFHSYGQYMIIPYAYSKKHHDNFDEVQRIGIFAAVRIEKHYGTQYTIGTAYDTVGYVTSGVSGCWVKKSFSTPYVITFELRDDGKHGFALPPHEILPTCIETVDGVLSILRPEKRLGNIPKIKSNASKVDKIFDKFLVFCNFVLFIIVRY